MPDPLLPQNGRVADRRRLDAILAQLKLERATWEALWRELNDFILPTRAKFTITDRNKGDRRNQKIIDSTATFAARTLGSGMHSGLTSPARPWFRLTVPDTQQAEEASVKAWLSDVTEILLAVLLKSNAYQVLPTLYEDGGTFATGAMAMYEDDEDVVRFYDLPIGTYWIGNDAKRRVRVFAQEIQLTVRQLVEQFGGVTPDGQIANPDTFSITVQDAWRNNRFEEWVTIAQVIEPNPRHRPNALASQFKRFRSVTWERGQAPELVLEDKGFDEFPILAFRWQVTGSDVYGTNCPGVAALGDVKQLQTMKKKGAQALDKVVNPPLKAAPAMRTQRVSVLPGDVTYDPSMGVGNSSGLAPIYEVKPDFAAWANAEDALRFLIRRAYFEDLFLMLDNLDRKDITATEVLERKEEKMLALGPVLERSNQDVLKPMIDRLYAICERKGMIPPPPEELQGQELKVEYLSVMAQAQKATAIAGLERFVGTMTTLAEIVPESKDKWDVDQFIDEYGDATAVPPRLIVPDEQVQQVRQARAQAAAQQQQAAQLAQIAPAAKQLSETNTGGDNALTQIMGGALGQSLAGAGGVNGQAA